MFEKMKFSAFANTWEPYHDRFSVQNPNDQKPPLDYVLKEIHNSGVFSGVELVYPGHINKDNFREFHDLVKVNDLSISAVVASVSSLEFFKEGALIADDPKTRRLAIGRISDAIEIAKEVNSNKVVTWLGRDGYDYPFQQNYDKCWKRLVEAYREICSVNPGIQVCLNYKIKEPCNWLIVSTAAKSLLLIQEVERDNLGVCFDCGHALAANENIAESVALLSRNHRLFHTHLNDNTRFWDDDLTIGSIHFLEMFEMMYWLNKTNYTGWLSLDPHVKTGDATSVMVEGVNFIKGMIKVLGTIGETQMEEAINSHSVSQILSLIQKELFGE